MTPTKTFTYDLNIDAVPYNEDTAKIIYGSKAQFNPDFPEDVLAQGFAFQLIQDAITHVNLTKQKFLSGKVTSVEELNLVDRTFWIYLSEKEQRYIKAQETLVLSTKQN